MIYNPVNEVNQSNFFSFNFLKKYRKSTALLLIWKYRYRGTNFSKIPSTGTAVLLQSTVPTYDYDKTQRKWRLFALCLFLVTNQNKARNEYFYFTVKQLFIGKRHKSISTQFSQKKTKNKTLKIIISFCGLTFFFMYLLHFTKKKKKLPYIDKTFWNYVISHFLLGL